MALTQAQRCENARQFVNEWKGKGDEKSDSQRFWITFFTEVMGIEDAVHRIVFEKRVVVEGHTKFIDVYIPETKALIEQKSYDKPLDKKYGQSGGDLLTPFEQGYRYGRWLPHEENPRWIMACNFGQFEIHDMNKPGEPPVVIDLIDLPDRLSAFDFLFNSAVNEISHEMKVSMEAGALVGRLYDMLRPKYHEETQETLHSLNALCVRIVFCLYAEDAGIFGSTTAVHDYLAPIPPKKMRKALVELFEILDTPIANRDKYLADDNPALAAFPYVNGGLFSDSTIEIPPFDDELKNLLIDDMSAGFDWSDISPTIFGAVFESTLNPETRRSGGMHYTSIENIHKVIDPLFLTELKDELSAIKADTQPRKRIARLKAYQQKLAGLKFLDPACGSGNFLTETYISLRRLENEAVMETTDAIVLGEEFNNPIRVSLAQFYGIEINDFAVAVAKTALWIAESQMRQETEKIVSIDGDFLPLKSYTNIVEGNALRVDWETVVPKNELNYIMGNPPFIGASMMTKEQKAEAVAVFGKVPRVNSIDYVGAWYHKAAKLMSNGFNSIKAAFLSTNSITQGEQVFPLWKKLYTDYNLDIIFAHRTFKWDSQSHEKAAVHCVIIGFTTCPSQNRRLLFQGDVVTEATNISPYLIDAPSVFISARANALCNAKRMTAGNKPADGGHLILSEEERQKLLEQDASLAPLIRRYIGARDYINNSEVRYCLWLKDVSPNKYRHNKEIMRRLEAVRAMRLNSSAAPTRALADMPYRFFSTPQTEASCLCIPEVSSENRKYIPIGFLEKDAIASNKLLIIPDGSLYDFGMLISNVHMAWMRAIAGRMKSDYQYSGAVVYNNFPWPTVTDKQREEIAGTAQAILDARALYPDSSLADLYDETTMPPELRKAHRDNDRAVMRAYGFNIKETSEADCVAHLMKLYQTLTTEK